MKEKTRKLDDSAIYIISPAGSKPIKMIIEGEIVSPVMAMANFYQVFKNERICKYAKSYCEYDGDVEVVCGKCAHGKLFCHKCSNYEPKDKEG